MHRPFVVTIIMLCAATSAAIAQDPHQSYQEFRRNMHRDYQQFRSRILEQYADFLDGEWHPYEPLKSPEKYTRPKPETAPEVTGTHVSPPDRAIPQPPVPAPPAPQQPQPAPQMPATPRDEVSQSLPGESFDFYGMTVTVPQVEFNILNRVSGPQDAAAAWRALDKSDARRALAYLKEKADSMGLNGYLTYELIHAYARGKFRRADSGAIASLEQYMMANLGYDVRLGLADRRVPVLLIPFDQTVYSRLYLNLNGRNYTAFGPEGTDITAIRDISTYTLPSTGDTGRTIDLRINGLNLPHRPHAYDIEGGGLHISGELNANLFALLYRYPQMPTGDFASSTLDPGVREHLVSQLRGQLSGLEPAEAVNRLMALFHQGLSYATDEQRHGFEKPYFLEETLFYDKCDCEDRAIAFTYLVWNVLGLPAQLIAYPMHESAAVSVDNGTVSGYNYTSGGRRYYSADPTYIGSRLGDVMPTFANTAPKIDKTYE